MYAARRGYHSILGKPIGFVPSNVAVYSYFEMLNYVSVDLAMGWNLGMIASGALARVSLIPIQYLFQSVTMKPPKSLENTFSAFYNVTIRNEINYHVKKQGITSGTHQRLLQEFSPSNTVSKLAQGYFLLSFFRAVHTLADSETLSGLLWVSSIGTFDPIFLTPLLFGAVNFVGMSHTQIWKLAPTVIKLGVAGISVFASVLNPVCYTEAWIGVVAAHAAINRLRHKDLLNKNNIK